MFINILLNLTFVLIIAAYAAANIIMTILAIEDGNTIKDILSEQDIGLGKVGVSIMYWPTFAILYIRSLRRINTDYSFEEDI